MFAFADGDRSAMFSGVARSRRVRDAAILALWLSIVGGFLAHVATPATSQLRQGSTVVATAEAQAAGARVQ